MNNFEPTSLFSVMAGLARPGLPLSGGHPPNPRHDSLSTPLTGGDEARQGRGDAPVPKTDGMTARLFMSPGQPREAVRTALASLGFAEADDPGATAQGADLLIADYEGLLTHQAEIKLHKQWQSPLHTPCLLVASPGELQGLEPGDAPDFDELITTPLHRLELNVRLKSLAHARRLSWRLRRDYFTLAEQSPVAIVMVNPQGEVVYANQAALGLSGVPPSALAGTAHHPPHWIVTDHEGRILPEGQMPFNRVVLALRPVRDARLAVHTDAGQRLLSVNASPLLDGHGLLEGVVVTAVDVTAKVAAKQKLEVSENRLRGVVDHMGSGLAVFRAADGDGGLRFDSLNKAGQAMLGRTEAEVEGKGLLEVLPAADRAGLSAGLDRVWRTGESSKLDATHYKDDGLDLWLEARAFKLPTGELGAMFDDVTDRVQDSTALAHSEQLYRDLFENAPVAYLTMRGQDGVVLDCNKAAEKLFGRPRQKLRGATMANMADDASENMAKVERAAEQLRQGQAVQDLELRMSRQDSGKFWVRLYAQPRLDKQGRLREVRVALLDITKSKNLEGQLRQAQKMESLGTLAGGVAHDLNNILTPILGFSEIAANDLPPGHALRRHLGHITQSARRAGNLVSQILAFARQNDASFAVMALDTAIKEPLRLLAASLPSNVRINRRIEAGDHNIVGDPTQLHQVLMNLCVNAAQALGKNSGEVTVGVDNVSLPRQGGQDRLPPGDYVRLWVRDNGPGMTEEVRQKAFEPYFTTKGQSEGTGLGLAVVHGIVQNHGGAIMVHSEPGQGCLFEILFPQAEASAARPAARALGDLPKGHEAILLVDDEISAGAFFKEALTRLGYDVTLHQNPFSALKCLKRNPKAYDLVITDQAMPGLTGIELTAHLRRIRADLPVLLFTGLNKNQCSQEPGSQELSGIITKPPRMSQVAAMVRQALDSPPNRT